MYIKSTKRIFAKAAILTLLSSNVFADLSTTQAIVGTDDNQEPVTLISDEICAYPETAIRLNSSDGEKGIWRVRTIRKNYRSIRDYRSSVSLKKANNGQVYVLFNKFYEQVKVQLFDQYTLKGTVTISNPYLSSTCQWATFANPSIEEAYSELGMEMDDDSSKLLNKPEEERYSWRTTDGSVGRGTSNQYTGPYNGSCRVGDRYTDYYPQSATAYKETGNGPWIVTGCR